MLKNIELAVIGAGPAGLAAAISARRNGINDIVIFERGDKAGGILPQCIHNGFGLHILKKELTGPEYAEHYLREVQKENIEIQLNTMVVNISTNTSTNTSNEKIVTTASAETGVTQFKAKAIVLAMGCRERTRGAINIAGTRPAGILTAGAAQRFVNIEGYMPGKKVVIIGSGDIGLIMARRMTLEGAKVLSVCEIMPKSSGLQRNIIQCLNDFNIPLLLSHTVCEIHGKDRVTGVTIAKVDENLKPIEDTKHFVSCDTLLLSVGLIPENELSQSAGVILAENGGAKTDKFMRTNINGIFACGNVVHVHDLVDYVTEEGEEAGKNASFYIRDKEIEGEGYALRENENSGMKKTLAENEHELVCIACPTGCKMSVFLDKENKVDSVSGNLCKRGIRYALEEFTSPRRVLTSTVYANINGKKCYVPVKTNGTIPKELLIEAMNELSFIEIENPVSVGSIVLQDILGTGVDVVATDNFG